MGGVRELAFPGARAVCLESGGRPTEEVIADEAERAGVDLVVMSTHGRSGLAHFLLGSLAGAVLRRVRVPVLLVRAPTAAARRSQRDAATRQTGEIPAEQGKTRSARVWPTWGRVPLPVP